MDQLLQYEVDETLLTSTHLLSSEIVKFGLVMACEFVGPVFNHPRPQQPLPVALGLPDPSPQNPHRQPQPSQGLFLPNNTPRIFYSKL